MKFFVLVAFAFCVLTSLMMFHSLPPPPTASVSCPESSVPRDVLSEYAQVHQRAVALPRVLWVRLPLGGGLCNRFQTLVSGLALALVTRRALVWEWDHMEPVQANPQERIGQTAFHELFKPLPFDHNPPQFLQQREARPLDVFADTQNHVPVLSVDRYDFWGAALWEKHPWLPLPDALFKYLFTPLGEPLPLVECDTLIQRRAQWDRHTAPMDKFLECAADQFSPTKAIVLDDSNPSSSGYCRNGTVECDLPTIHRMIQLGKSCRRAVLTHTSTFGACIASLIGTLRAPEVRWVDSSGRCLPPIHYMPLVEAGTLSNEPRQVLASLKPLITVLVLSRRTGFDRRQAIREAWAKNYYGTSVFFIIADRDCGWPKSQEFDCAPVPDQRPTMQEWKQHRKRVKDTKKRLEEEHQTYGDLVFVECIEAYRQLPCKMKQAYSWALKNMPSSKWFVKADDDAVVRVSRLSDYLSSVQTKTPYAMIGCVYDDRSVWRGGKWEELDYPLDVYPPFALGSCGHAVTRELAQVLVDMDGHEYQGEDTSIGIWINESRKAVSLIDDRVVFTNSGSCNKHASIMGHGMSVEQIRTCE